MYGSHDMRHTGFRRLTVVIGTPGFWGVTALVQDLERTRISDSSYRGKGTCIVLLGRNGIPEWIIDRRSINLMRTNLPQNWHRSNEFLGFAIIYVFVPVSHKSAHEFENESGGESVNGSFCKNEQNYTHSYSLVIGDGYESEWMDFPLFESNCYCYKEDKDEDNGSVSGQTLVVCYSKEVIGERFRFDEWTKSEIRARYEDFNNNSEKAFKLCSLRNLKLHAYNLREIPSEICQLSSLESLSLRGNHFSYIPDGISQLYKLKLLDLSYCKMLQYIPQLPSGLLFLDAHHSTSCKIYSNVIKTKFRYGFHISFNLFFSWRQNLEGNFCVGA